MVHTNSTIKKGISSSVQNCFSYNLKSRLLEDARALEKAGYLKPTDKSRVGNSQAFSNNYGFDYAKEQKSREE